MSASSKRGLCFPKEHEKEQPVFPFTKPGSKISWLYNWSSEPTPNASSLEFVIMQWNHINIDQLQDKVKTANARTVLGFNEPELPDQSNLSPSLAAQEWLRSIEPLRKAGIRCGSPGISSAPQGVVWLKDFLQRIRDKGGDIDFYCFHWYGETLGQFYDYIWSTHHQLGADKPVWITEFAPTNWNTDNPLPRDHVENFAKESVKYLETLDWVERYAWFGAMRDTGNIGRWARMLNDEGHLTPLGKAYRDE